MIEHVTDPVAQRFLRRINTDIDIGGELVEFEVRKRLVKRVTVNPCFTILDSIGPGPADEVLPDGSRLMKDGSKDKTHFRFNVAFCDVIPEASRSPDDDYMNGMQELTPEGWLRGHLHGKIYALKDEQQINDYFSGKNVALPFYVFKGGPPWYTRVKQRDGSWTISWNTLTGVVFDPTLLYIMEVDLVNLDDTETNTVLHGQKKGLRVVFKVRPPAG